MYASPTMFSCRYPIFRSATLASAAVLALEGCTPGMSAAVDSVRQAVGSGSAVETSKLDPNFAYLRVTRGKHVGLLWRGNVERSPGGPVEVYYSSTGEVVRLRDGRLMGALGLVTEWRYVADPAPGWADMVKSREPAAFVRTRDVMPGYRSGVRDELVLRRITPPERTGLRDVDPGSLSWFEESVRDAGGRSRIPGVASDTLPPARYALDLAGEQPIVVYSEQCLALDLCFTWQRWPAAIQRGATSAR